MKTAFNPLIEAVALGLFGVDQYADVFEKLALSRHHRPLLRSIGRRRLAPDIAAAPLLFVHVPKNGGTSVKQTLYRSDPGHASVRYYDLFFPEFLRRVTSFAIVRDPVDRFLSGFDFLLNGGGGDVRIQSRPLRRIRHIETIDALLDHLEASVARGGWLAVDTFLRPQSWYLTDINQSLRIGHLWALDQAMGELAAFLRRHGGAELAHANRTRRESRALDNGQCQRLRLLYPDDFTLHAWVRDAGGHIADPARQLSGSRP